MSDGPGGGSPLPERPKPSSTIQKYENLYIPIDGSSPMPDFEWGAVKDRRSMKKPTVKYSKGEIGRVRIVEDFLPSPDQLVLREDNVKVTLSLSQRSVAVFKRAARQRRVPYQRMIRALVDAYAEKQGGKG